jgi:hypothetical protein
MGKWIKDKGKRTKKVLTIDPFILSSYPFIQFYTLQPVFCFAPILPLA